MKDLFFASRRETGTPVNGQAVALNSILVLALLTAAFYAAFFQLDYRWNWMAVYKYRHKLIEGWWVTVWISLASLGLSTLIGLLFALGQRSRFLPLRFLSKFYVAAIRGTPLLVQILIFFYVVAQALHVENRYVVGILTLSIFSGAYIAEVIRSGIESVGRSQIESAMAIGFTRAQTYRYVVFPQALRQVLPPLAGQFVSLIKDSSLLSIISISEFTLNAQEVNSNTFSTLESYLPLAVGYLMLTLPVSLVARALERRFSYET